jgi:hypothetical protein
MADNKSGGTGNGPSKTPQGGDKGGHSTLGDQVRNPQKAPDAGQPSSQRKD